MKIKNFIKRNWSYIVAVLITVMPAVRSAGASHRFQRHAWVVFAYLVMEMVYI